jgi:hypothetical protein
MSENTESTAEAREPLTVDAGAEHTTQETESEAVERGFTEEQQDTEADSPVVVEGTKDFRLHIEEVLSAGGQVNPRELAVAGGVATVEEADELHTVGMTLPSVSTEAGVAGDGSVVDRRNDDAMRFRRIMLGEEKPPDNFEVVPGVTVARAAAASRGLPADDSVVDTRRVVLVDHPHAVGATLAAVTVETEDEDGEDEVAETGEG